MKFMCNGRHTWQTRRIQDGHAAATVMTCSTCRKVMVQTFGTSGALDARNPAWRVRRMALAAKIKVALVIDQQRRNA